MQLSKNSVLRNTLLRTKEILKIDLKNVPTFGDTPLSLSSSFFNFFDGTKVERGDEALDV